MARVSRRVSRLEQVESGGKGARAVGPRSVASTPSLSAVSSRRGLTREEVDNGGGGAREPEPWFVAATAFLCGTGVLQARRTQNRINGGVCTNDVVSVEGSKVLNRHLWSVLEKILEVRGGKWDPSPRTVRGG